MKVEEIFKKSRSKISDKDLIRNFATLIKTGSIKDLEPVYNEMAKAFINEGYISNYGEILIYPK